MCVKQNKLRKKDSKGNCSPVKLASERERMCATLTASVNVFLTGVHGQKTVKILEVLGAQSTNMPRSERNTHLCIQVRVQQCNHNSNKNTE